MTEDYYSLIEKSLKNKEVKSFTIMEHGFCSLVLSDGYSVGIEGLVRFLSKDGNVIYAKDHGHLFGLKTPMDMEVKFNEYIKGKIISKVEINRSTDDLKLIFNSGVFEIICNSTGYDSYCINGPDDFVLVSHGHGISRATIIRGPEIDKK